VVTGTEKGLELVRELQPAVIVPLNNADGSYQGLAAGAVTSSGSSAGAAIQQWLSEQGIRNVRVAAPSGPGGSAEILL
jgi:hypothetical protein